MSGKDRDEDGEISNKIPRLEQCKYGADCYRKNPAHLLKYEHPVKSGESNSRANSTDDTVKSFDLFKNEFYLTKVNNLNNDNFKEISLADILSSKHGNLLRSAQFNFMCDCDWLMAQYSEEFRDRPLLLVHGEMFDKRSINRPNIKSCQATLPIAYGTHHTKMMLLHYENGVRVIVHTANLIPEDWASKTQCLWISPIFPKLTSNKDVIATTVNYGDSITSFKTDLIEYLSSYKKAELNDWTKLLQQYDFSLCRVYFICSVPGKFKGVQKEHFGHMKLRKVLRNDFIPIESDGRVDLVAQFSSIGSLGPTADSWLCSEFQSTLLMSSPKGSTKPLSGDKDLHLIYPCVEDVKESLEGYLAGSSLPYQNHVHQKQQWIMQFLRKWRANSASRTRASPHMKSYLRSFNSGTCISWFLITSANLSKAAWGGFLKKGGEFMIRSYEAGVLFLPEKYGVSCFKHIQPVDVSIPYDLPPIIYDSNDKPWTVDTAHISPDICGNVWSP